MSASTPPRSAYEVDPSPVTQACRKDTIFQGRFKREIEAINKRELAPRAPTLPIQELRRLLGDDFAAKTGGDLDPSKLRKMMIELLDEAGQAGREEQGVPPSFELFLGSWSGPLFKDVLMKTAQEHGDVTGVTLLPEAYRVHHDKHAIATVIGLMAANMYRKATGTMRNGEGCFSDVWNVMEVAHSDRLLTRDIELHECGRLVKGVIKDMKPVIELVPRP